MAQRGNYSQQGNPIVAGTSVLIRNLTVRPEDAPDWFQSHYFRYASETAPDMVRTVWTRRENNDNRVIVDVYEAESAVEAKQFLSVLLSRCSDRPVVIGDNGSNTEKERVAKDTQFVLVGNLVLGIMRFGVFETALDQWSAHLNRRAREKPEHFLDQLKITMEEFSEEGVTFARITYEAPGFEEPYEVRFFSDDGELFLRKGEVLLKLGQGRPARVEGYALRGDGVEIKGDAKLL